MKSSIFTKFTKVLSLSVLTLGLTTSSLHAETKKDFKVAWSIYVGWMPWDVIASEKIIDKWATKYGINIDLVQINDYIESINQYSAGQFDGAAMVNIDALSIPAASGVDSTVLIMGDYSNGNDVIISKTANDVKDLKGSTLNLLELSVSHYFLARTLEKNGLSERDISIVNTSDADIVSAYTTADVQNVVAWKPQVSEIMKMDNAKNIYDSSKIPGEIMDMLVVNTQTLKDNPNFGKAMVGAWYEMMGIMTSNSEKSKKYKTFMAMNSGTDLAGFNDQLKTTHMYYDAKKAVEFVQSPEIIKTMKFISKFSFDHGLYGDGASDENFVGIEFPNGKTIGDKGNIKLRFDDTYMKMAAESSL
ncbi:putative urea ABC transporter substrate-binding protein [Poseidonibacter lekithochrous]|uniref:putative urea ABC transporter substrate-binding protein n=1 Tax=Poseidonibacter TaxID=2321187 RepID=UPI001C080BE3|nr:MULTISPECIES: putative urea ABC transporter substrate-binding protein [Poseidonibacter]MBU3015839.1 putative urea ABC transporter substrate-binding protein [Poseidonibacter lekithochrous]MDO6829138.1 putative urea ABC transporter substrate-binding protein [Poseidonibacter sp. 1_MG-2023]